MYVNFSYTNIFLSKESTTILSIKFLQKAYKQLCGKNPFTKIHKDSQRENTENPEEIIAWRSSVKTWRSFVE